jgi:hypothetical protein
VEKNMNSRTSAAAMLSSLLLVAIAFFVLPKTPGRHPAVGSVVQAATARQAPAEPLPFEEVIEQLNGEHRALEAAELLGTSSSRLRSLYLECARQTSEQRMDVDESLYCQAVADVLMHRDFAGNLDLLLEWWQQRSGNDGRMASAVRT